MRSLIVIAVLLAFIPAAVYAGDCGCSKCKQQTCSSCDTCKSKCDSGCKSKCDSCKPKCDSGCKSKCNSCKPKCETGCKSKCGKCNECKPKCESGCKSKCDGGCKSKCNSCEAKPACSKCGQKSCSGGCGQSSCSSGCAKPCACTEWNQYCGCEMLSSLCISLQACDGTAGPLMLKLRDTSFKTIADIELAGPIDGYYNYTYTFAEPIPASSLQEAVIINSTDDAATLTWFSVFGNFDCGGFSYFDYSCPGVVVGPGGCPRMVLF
jgi:hypothetical protein